MFSKKDCKGFKILFQEAAASLPISDFKAFSLMIN
jgi:hypothetical protein